MAKWGSCSSEVARGIESCVPGQERASRVRRAKPDIYTRHSWHFHEHSMYVSLSKAIFTCIGMFMHVVEPPASCSCPLLGLCTIIDRHAFLPTAYHVLIRMLSYSHLSFVPLVEAYSWAMIFLTTADARLSVLASHPYSHCLLHIKRTQDGWVKEPTNHIAK